MKVQTKAELSLQTRMPVRKSFPLPTTMNAVIWTEYGPASALKMGNIEVPQPSADQILVRVFASSVASGDVKMRAFDVPAIFWLPMRLMLGLFRPRRQVPGMEFCGEVVSVGSNAPNFRTGDQVFGMVGQGGAHAEYLVVGASEAACIRPSKLDAVEAAVVPFGALSALCALRDFAQVQAGERIAIYGASGAVGVFAVQLAKHFGAHVTAICSSRNIELVRSLGADEVIDYENTAFWTLPISFDKIVDTIGVVQMSDCKQVLVAGGRLVTLAFGSHQLLQMAWTWLVRGRRVICAFCGTDQKDLQLIGKLVDEGAVKPVVGRVFPIQQIEAAHEYVETGRKRGGAAITIAECREY